MTRWRFSHLVVALGLMAQALVIPPNIQRDKRSSEQQLVVSEPPELPSAKSKALVRELRRAKYGREVRALLAEHSEAVNAFAVSAAMSAHRRFGKPRDALKVFERYLNDVDQNKYLYSAAISASEKLGDWRKAEKLFREAQTKGIQFDITSYNALLTAFKKGRQWRKAMDLFEELDGNVDPNVITYSILIATCEKSRQWKKAVDVFKNMQKSGLEPNIVTYNSLISACGNACRW